TRTAARGTRRERGPRRAHPWWCARRRRKTSVTRPNPQAASPRISTGLDYTNCCSRNPPRERTATSASLVVRSSSQENQCYPAQPAGGVTSNLDWARLHELLLAEPAARQDRDERIPGGALVVAGKPVLPGPTRRRRHLESRLGSTTRTAARGTRRETGPRRAHPWWCARRRRKTSVTRPNPQAASPRISTGLDYTNCCSRNPPRDRTATSASLVVRSSSQENQCYPAQPAGGVTSNLDWARLHELLLAEPAARQD